jgi:hypothetical protein
MILMEISLMPSTGQGPAIGEGITSFLKVTLGIIKGFAERPEPGRPVRKLLENFRASSTLSSDAKHWCR